MDLKSIKTKVWIGCFIFFIVYVLSLMFLFNYKKQTIENPKEFIERIDSLDSKIDSVTIVKDSIQERIDTVYIKLEDNKKQYEENIHHIISNNVSEDYCFFLNYINSNRARLDSLSNNL